MFYSLGGATIPHGDKRHFGDRTNAHDNCCLVHTLVALTTRRQRPGAHRRTHPSHGAACSRHGAQHPRSVLVAGPEAVLHVVERRVERDDRGDVRLVGEDELLEARDDLIVGHRQRVDVEAEHARDHLAEVQQLSEHRNRRRSECDRYTQRLLSVIISTIYQLFYYLFIFKL